jgi:hypothetical protein
LRPKTETRREAFRHSRDQATFESLRLEIQRVAHDTLAKSLTQVYFVMKRLFAVPEAFGAASGEIRARKRLTVNGAVKLLCACA